MAEYRTVLKRDELPEETGRTVEVDGKLIAIFRYQGKLYAIDDTCPHMGASLAEGYVENGIVTCPWHAWRFRLQDGAWVDNPRLKIGCYAVREVGDEIQLALHEPHSS
ncbi:MAG: nitrite reductase small subunit NirD [Gemmatales bacterium]|nr:nitrite reductase small subunit NirD [Gemmatales bacterium]MCS7159258.1 nitrite reductase small subunit NirD [Gemmatales bacterium]MDW8174458.1 nitrite reductase small subunit NirD [Gemmatales bacterium]MDW8223948.1 nitrite reductase small subunit NirD [Gemmatales bacterium]